jgi:hypothetical protein
MWNVKCVIIPVVIAATGMAARAQRRTLEAVRGKRSADSLQTTAVLEHGT